MLFSSEISTYKFENSGAMLLIFLKFRKTCIFCSFSATNSMPTALNALILDLYNYKPITCWHISQLNALDFLEPESN